MLCGQCRECGASFVEKSEREKHIKKMHSCSCPKCEYMSFTGHGLMVHMKVHENDQHRSDGDQMRVNTGENPSECAVCGLKYTTESELQKHVETTHNISCELCSYKCDTTENLMMHMSDHNDVPSTETYDQSLRRCRLHARSVIISFAKIESDNLI